MTILGQTVADEVSELLTRRFAAEVDLDGPARIATTAHLAVAQALRDELGYRIFGFVIACHHPAASTGLAEEHFRVIYALRSVGAGSRLAAWQLEVRVDEAVASLAGLFAGADWQEREQYDLLGVCFENHPDLRRLMLPEDWKGHPLRKDYAIDTQVHPWR